MYKLTFVFLTLTVLAFAAGPSFAQQKISPEKEALIKELLDVTGSGKSTRDMANVMMTYQRQEIEKMAVALIDGDNTFTAAEKEQMHTIVAETVERLTKRITEFFTTGIDLDKAVLEISLPIYDKHFTESELREFIAFYRSAAGKKAIALMPELMMESMAGFSEKIGPKLTEFLKKTTDEELATLKQKVEEKKAAPPKPKPKTKS